MSNEKLAEALREPAEKFAQAMEKDADRIGGEWKTVLTTAAQCIRALLQAHAAEAAQAQAQPENPPFVLERWGFPMGPSQYRLERMQDGYWTPWHIAQQAIVDTRARMQYEFDQRLGLQPQAQAQSGEWVMVPREPTERMLQAAEDAVNAAAHCESTTDDLSAIAYKAALAAAPQRAAESVRQFRVVPKGSVWTDVKDPEIWASVIAHPESYETRVLYTHPQPAQDAKDAARYRWLRDSADSYTWDYLGGIGAARVDAAIDAAMAKGSGR